MLTETNCVAACCWVKEAMLTSMKIEFTKLEQKFLLFARLYQLKQEYFARIQNSNRAEQKEILKLVISKNIIYTRLRNFYWCCPKLTQKNKNKRNLKCCWPRMKVNFLTWCCSLEFWREVWSAAAEFIHKTQKYAEDGDVLDTFALQRRWGHPN